jgi:hypothetical protein
MLRTMDTIVVVVLWAALILLSIISLVQKFRGTGAGYGQLSVIPKSWQRWIFDEGEPEAHGSDEQGSVLAKS